MKKILIIATVLLLNNCAKVAAQNLTVASTSTCPGKVLLNLLAGDASVSCGATGNAQINFLLSSSGFTENIYDFNSGGAGPYYWASGSGPVGAGAFWILSQTGYRTSGTTIGSYYYTCGTFIQTSSITSGGCTVYLSWNEDPTTHDVEIDIN